MPIGAIIYLVFLGVLIIVTILHAAHNYPPKKHVTEITLMSGKKIYRCEIKNPIDGVWRVITDSEGRYAIFTDKEEALNYIENYDFHKTK